MKRRNLNDLREEMRAVARGERVPSPRPAAPLAAALTREALEIFAILLEERPESVAEIAERTGRQQPNVSRSLQHLVGLGLVRLHRKGKQVTPEPLARGVKIDFATATYELQLLEVMPA